MAGRQPQRRYFVQRSNVMRLSDVVLANLVLVAAQRSATVHEVQPSARDRVHAIWLNGPTFSSKVAGAAQSLWPSFQNDLATRSRSARTFAA